MGFLVRLLLFAALVWLALRMVQRALAARGNAASPPPAPYEATARCARCGVHVPAQALTAAGICGRCAEQK